MTNIVPITDSISISPYIRPWNGSWILNEKFILLVLRLHDVKWENYQWIDTKDVEAVQSGTVLFTWSTVQITITGTRVRENTLIWYQTGCRRYWRNQNMGEACLVEECLPRWTLVRKKQGFALKVWLIREKTCFPKLRIKYSLDFVLYNIVL